MPYIEYGKEEIKQPTKKWNMTLRGVILLIILLYLVFYYMNSKENKEEYKSCIDECVSDSSDCVSMIDGYEMKGDIWGDSYIAKSKVGECLDELEWCVDEC